MAVEALRREGRARSGGETLPSLKTTWCAHPWQPCTIAQGPNQGRQHVLISHKGTRLHRNGVLECSPASHLLNVCLWRCTMSTYGLQIVQMGGRKLKHRGGVWDGLQSNSTLYVCFNLQRNVKCPWMQKNLSKAYRRFSAAQQCSLHAPQVFMRHAVQRDPSGAPTGVRQH